MEVGIVVPKADGHFVEHAPEGGEVEPRPLGVRQAREPFFELLERPGEERERLPLEP